MNEQAQKIICIVKETKKVEDEKKFWLKNKRSVVTLTTTIIMLFLIITSLLLVLMLPKKDNLAQTQLKTEVIELQATDTEPPAIVEITYKPVVYSVEGEVVIGVSYKDNDLVTKILILTRFNYEPWERIELSKSTAGGGIQWGFDIDKEEYEWFEGAITIIDRTGNEAFVHFIVDIIQGAPQEQKMDIGTMLSIIGGIMIGGSVITLVLLNRKQVFSHLQKMIGESKKIVGGKRK